ncbi:hypothetical protein OAG68_01455 [bacterium]|nr:hypothetical protein [bacterium]
MKSKLSERQWIERIKSAYVDKDFPRADQLIAHAMEETGSAPKLLEIAGMLAYERGDFRESIGLLEGAMFEICLSISAQLTMVNAWLKVGNQKSAETALVFLVDVIDRVPCTMLRDLTHSVVEIGREDLAAKICQTAFQRHPDDDNAAFAIGYYAYRSGGSAELALRYMHIATELNPDSSFYRINLEQNEHHIFLWCERSESPYVMAISKEDGRTVWNQPGLR